MFAACTACQLGTSQGLASSFLPYFWQAPPLLAEHPVQRAMASTAGTGANAGRVAAFWQPAVPLGVANAAATMYWSPANPSCVARTAAIFYRACFTTALDHLRSMVVVSAFPIFPLDICCAVHKAT